jgi:large subunit ribosomal protein L23Ae
LVFIVDLRANKKRIKEAINKLYDIQACKINTLVRPDGKKKAFIKLTADLCALNIADRIGIV